MAVKGAFEYSVFCDECGLSDHGMASFEIYHYLYHNPESEKIKRTSEKFAESHFVCFSVIAKWFEDEYNIFNYAGA
jgi:hypothetical protein